MLRATATAFAMTVIAQSTICSSAAVVLDHVRSDIGAIGYVSNDAAVGAGVKVAVITG